MTNTITERKGRATVRRHPASGQWYGRWRDGYGRQHHQPLGRDRARAQARLEAHIEEAAAVRRGERNPEDERRQRLRNRAIGDQIDDYGLTLKSRGTDPTHRATTDKYRQDFVGWVNRDGPVIRTAAHIDRAMAEAYVAAIQAGDTARVYRGVSAKAGRTPSNRTINARIGAVQEMLGELHARGVLSENVLRGFPKLPTGGAAATRRPRALTETEQITLITKTADAGRRDLYEFSLGTGARRSASEALLVADVDFEQGVIRLKSKRKPASKRPSHYVVPMTPALRSLLVRRCEGRGASDCVFVVPSHARAAALLRRDCEAAGVAVVAVRFHSLRHSFCTSLARAGVHPGQLQKLADHADLTTTLLYYVHWTAEDAIRAMLLSPVASFSGASPTAIDPGPPEARAA